MMQKLGRRSVEPRFSLRLWVLLVAGLGLPVMALRAQVPGFQDPGYAAGGKFFVGPRAESLVRQRDGRILMGGLFGTVGGGMRSGLARLRADLRLDPGFQVGLGLTRGGPLMRGEAACLVVQADGKILVGGQFDAYNGVSCFNLIRLHADGSVDETFSRAVGFNDWVHSLALQADGKILVGGDFTFFGAVSRNRVARLQPDGELDLDFDPLGGANGPVNKVLATADGGIFIGGSFTEYRSVTRGRVARLQADGSLDGGFNSAPGANGTVRCMHLLRDGEVLIGGNFESYGGTSRRAVARLRADGSLDPDFPAGPGPDGLFEPPSVHSITPAPRGRFLIGGFFDIYDDKDCRATALVDGDGRLVSGYGALGPTVPGGVRSAVSLGGGRHLVSGSVMTDEADGIAVLDARGRIQRGVFAGGGANAEVKESVAVGDGRRILVGAFTRYGGVPVPGIARVRRDGGLDQSFQTDVVGLRRVSKVVRQADGRLIIRGEVQTLPGGPIQSRLFRLHPDGAQDLSFTTGGDAAGDILAMLLQPDGRLLIGGSFTSFNGLPRVRVARLMPNGNVDLSFEPGDGADGSVRALALDSSGRILIGGQFFSFNSIGSVRICRLESNGDVDLTFNPGSGASGTVHALQVLPNGQILVGGEFSVFNLSLRSGVAVLQSNGSVFSGFTPGTGANERVLAVATQGDGKILLGGDFTMFNGVIARHLMRLLPDGSVDGSFSSDPGAGSTVESIEVDNDGTAFVTGGFPSVGGVRAAYASRVLLNFRYGAGRYEGAAFFGGSDQPSFNGGFRLVMQRGGAFSATLAATGERLRFRGFFGGNGEAEVRTGRRNGDLILLSLVARGGAEGRMELSGRIKNFAETRFAAVEAVASVRRTGNPMFDFAGRYHVVLTATSHVGHLVCSVSANGRVRLSGKMLDNTRVVAGSYLNDAGGVVVHRSLHGGRGYLNGKMEIDALNFGVPLRPVSGSLYWQRPPGGLIETGLEDGLSVVSSGLYRARALPLPPFGGLDPNSVRIVIGGGHLPDGLGALSSTLSFSAAGVGVVAGGTLEQLRVRVDRRTGLFRGRFVPPGQTRAVSFDGVISDVNTGLGAAILPGPGGRRASVVQLVVDFP